MIKKIFFCIFLIINKFNYRFIYRALGLALDKFKMRLLSLSGAKIGLNSIVRPNTFILNPNNLTMGNNSTIGSNSEIFNSRNFYIGDNVDIGTQFYINTDNHKFNDPKKFLSKQGVISSEIIIGSDIWIGARVTILAGVKINDRVIVGACSLINKDLESGYIYAGVPAKKIKKINEN